MTQDTSGTVDWLRQKPLVHLHFQFGTVAPPFFHEKQVSYVPFAEIVHNYAVSCPYLFKFIFFGLMTFEIQKFEK
jgi:hypothetical protein